MQKWRDETQKAAELGTVIPKLLHAHVAVTIKLSQPYLFTCTTHHAHREGIQDCQIFLLLNTPFAASTFFLIIPRTLFVICHDQPNSELPTTARLQNQAAIAGARWTTTLSARLELLT